MREHNFANYMFFLMHLINKPDTEYTGQVFFYLKNIWIFSRFKFNYFLFKKGNLRVANVSAKVLGVLSGWWLLQEAERGRRGRWRRWWRVRTWLTWPVYTFSSWQARTTVIMLCTSYTYFIFFLSCSRNSTLLLLALYWSFFLLS
jgi:hypothetical protein